MPDNGTTWVYERSNQMIFSNYISELLANTAYGPSDKLYQSVKSWISEDKTLYVINAEIYNNCLEEIYKHDNKISSRFSRKTVTEYIEKQIPTLKKSESLKIDSNDFFKSMLSIEPRNFTIKAPISGIRLDGDPRSFSIAPYTFGYLDDIDLPISNDKGMYIGIEIKGLYDRIIAISKAENAFLDFARLIVFISGKLDSSIVISTGLPLMANHTHELMFVSTKAYIISDGAGNIESGSISNRNIEKVPINNNFFCANQAFEKLWKLNEKRINGAKLNDIDSRLINSALALGESALTPDKKNSIIYTCIAMEIMFSLNEGELFQKSIGVNIADLFTFLVAKDKDSRLEISKLVKKVYSMRSAIVHGGEKDLTDNNLLINYFMRPAICELMNSDKFKHIKKLEELNKMLKDAQNSY